MIKVQVFFSTNKDLSKLNLISLSTLLAKKKKPKCSLKMLNRLIKAKKKENQDPLRPKTENLSFSFNIYKIDI